jgi:hypothetical protein
MADDDDDDELKCRQKVQLNEQGKKAAGSAVGATPQAARTNAYSVAREAALRAALEAANAYSCPEECPSKRFNLHLSKPELDDDPVKQMMGNEFDASATCAWSCTLSCEATPANPAAVEAQLQDFECDDPWTVIAEGRASGKGVDGKPVDPLADPGGWAVIAAKIAQSLSKAIVDALATALYRFRCPSARCPAKVLRITLWPSEVAQAGPDPNGNFTWTPSEWYRVEAKCSRD